MKIGVIVDGFKKPLAEGLALAAACGFSGVQIYAFSEEFHPGMSEEKKAFFKGLLSRYHLEVSALCGDVGGRFFEKEENNAENVRRTKAAIDLAVEFGTRVVTTHIGILPAEKSHPRYGVMLRALREAGEYAASRGVTLAIETGPEIAATLLQFVEDIPRGVGVNLDPANFAMVVRQDPVAAVRMLGKYIVHTHAKDGICLRDDLTAEDVYAPAPLKPGEPPRKPGYAVVPLGTGAVNFDAYIGALREVGYDGYLTIENEGEEEPVLSIRTSGRFLERYL